MNEKDLSFYAIITCLLGFLALGYVVLFIPIQYDAQNNEYVDAVVQRVHKTQNGLIIVAKPTQTISFLYEDNISADVGENLRFYEPQALSPASDLQKVSFVRKLD